LIGVSRKKFKKPKKEPQKSCKYNNMTALLTIFAQRRPRTFMHSGYAVYFPELFPTRLRSTGRGFRFNAGRLLVPPILLFSGWMQRDAGISLTNAATLLSFLFPVGATLL
jgi:hypothetical protein